VSAAERRWYLLFTDEDGNLRGLLGPFKGGEQQARNMQTAALSLDAAVTSAVDWDDHEMLRVPYLYHHVQAIDLSLAEIEGMEAERYRETGGSKQP